MLNLKKIIMDTRKGFLTPEQEKILDDVIELKGLYEVADGPAIRIADNVGLQKLKEKYWSEKPEVLQYIYQFIDEVFASFDEN